jgi:chemotaxis protein MotB
MSKNRAVIVKKVKKVVAGGHHGGSWKVAYADFVTAMMAFFLLMWLLNMTSDEKRARLSAYFKYFSLYDSGGTSWMEKSSEIFGESGENSQKVFADKKNEALDNSVTSEELNNMEEALTKDIAEKLSDVQDQILVDIVDEGIRIQMIDKEGSLMFERGNTKLTPKAKEVLKLISADIQKYPNQVTIEGHTDSVPYAGSQYSNWELSTERASSARKELEATGLDPKRITRVAGYADTDPLIKDNKQDPRNRRISITLSAPKMDAPRRNAAKQAVTSSEEKQLKKVSEELGHMIDNSQIPAADEKKSASASSAHTESNKTGEGQPTVRKQEWPAFRPVEKIGASTPDEGKSSAARNPDYDSIIRDGQSSLKTGNNKSSKKDIPAPDKQSSNVKREYTGPSVIKELADPVIIKGIKNKPEIPVEEKTTVVKKNPDYDSIIREGQSSLKNGNKTSKNKVQSKSVRNRGLEGPEIKNETKGPSVIKELSEQVITKEKLFTIIPGGR